MASIAGPDQRAAIIQGFRNLLDYLEAHPDVPINPSYNEVAVSIIGESDEAKRAEIDRIGSVLNVTPSGDTHYKASRSFGPVQYKATAITDAWMQELQVADSYRSNVQVDAVTAAKAGATR